MTEEESAEADYWEAQERQRCEDMRAEAEYQEAFWIVAAAPLPVLDPNGWSPT